MFNFDTKIWLKCALCGVKFEGYHVQVCDRCMDRRNPGEDWLDFLARIKAEPKEDLELVKKPYFQLSPELADGQHWVPTDDINVVLDSVKEWCKENKVWVGQSFTIEVIEMTDAEIEALPDI